MHEDPDYVNMMEELVDEDPSDELSWVYGPAHGVEEHHPRIGTLEATVQTIELHAAL